MAAAVLIISRKLPAQPFEALPESDMTARFRESRNAGSPVGAPQAPWLPAPLGRVLRSLGAMRLALEQRAPRLADPEPPAPAHVGAAGMDRVRAFVRRTAPRIEPPEPAGDSLDVENEAT